jgi:hydroxymethylbilane synthase
MAAPCRSIRIGTRASRLALAQAHWVRHALESRWPGLCGELVEIVTSGDRLEGSLAGAGGKGLFVREIEAALYDRRVDCAVHSMKDLPVALPEGLVVAAVPARGDVRDVLVGPAGTRDLRSLPPGARVGTSSLRRRAQVLAARPDVRVVELRGNVDTRLRRREEGRCEAVVLAAAGLVRLGIGLEVGAPLSAAVFVPAVAQGALALETRSDDDDARALLGSLEDPAARRTVTAERAFLRDLGGDCVTPVAAHAEIAGEVLSLTGLVATPDGRTLLRDRLSGAAREPERLGHDLAERLRARGADDILAEVRHATP